METSLLWQHFKQHNCQKAREQLIERHVYLCKVTAGYTVNKLPANVERDDLMCSGYVGLIKAVDTYNPCRGVKFQTYAIALIRGAILEALREEDWVPRNAREKAKAIAQAERAFETRTGRAPSDVELEAALGWTADTLLAARRLTERTQLISLSEPIKGDAAQVVLLEETLVADGPAPWDEAWTAQRGGLLWQAIDQMPERERRLLRLYYNAGKTFQQIAKELSISESRVFQLHAQATKRLRARLGEDWRAEA